MRRFILVDDEINVLHALQRALRNFAPDEDIRFEIFTNPVEALVRIGEVNFDLVLSDYRMPEMTGVEFLSLVKEIQPDTVRLVLSASTEFDAVMGAINRAEVFRYIAKPWHINDLEEDIRLALIHRDQIVGDRHLADEVRVQRGELTPQELEAKRLEEEEPGITKVNWGPDGSILLD